MLRDLSVRLDDDWHPLVLSFATLRDYLQHARNSGANVGRYGGRTRDGRSPIDGTFHQLTRNLDGRHHLGPSPGAKARRTVRVRSLDARPVSQLTTWLPEDIGAPITEADLEQRSLLRLIEAGEALLANRRTVFDVEGSAWNASTGYIAPPLMNTR